MKTANLCRVEKPPERTEQTTLSKMEAIAFGVQAWFEENTGYSRRVTETTIDMARQLGIPEHEIEKWAASRLARLIRDTEKLNVIKDLLQRLQESCPAQAVQEIPTKNDKK